jgi:hypothetical protein
LETFQLHVKYFLTSLTDHQFGSTFNSSEPSLLLKPLNRTE